MFHTLQARYNFFMCVYTCVWFWLWLCICMDIYVADATDRRTWSAKISNPRAPQPRNT